jgi:hypothetical protein
MKNSLTEQIKRNFSSLQVLIKTLTDENELNPVEQITFANLLRKERN